MKGTYNELATLSHHFTSTVKQPVHVHVVLAGMMTYL